MKNTAFQPCLSQNIKNQYLGSTSKQPASHASADYRSWIKSAKHYLLALLSLAALSSCQDGKLENTGLTLEPQAETALEFENLRLYPILASEAFISQNPEAAGLLNLPEALENPRFRITEHKPFGRFGDADAVNTLTVQNKTESAVFLMAGDILQGGNQDRVIAQDAVIAARSIGNIPVFCVEPGRWSPHEEEAREGSEKSQNIYAFTGYYHVASRDVRRAAQYSNNQQEVWDKVAQVTAAHQASTATGTYTALEQSTDFTAARQRYLQYFSNKLEGRDEVVGVVAVSGKQVIGADVFAHPALFRKQYEALLHSYLTDALTSGAKASLEEQQMEAYGRKLLKRIHAASQDAPEGRFLHFTDL